MPPLWKSASEIASKLLEPNSHYPIDIPDVGTAWLSRYGRHALGWMQCGCVTATLRWRLFDSGGTVYSSVCAIPHVVKLMPGSAYPCDFEHLDVDPESRVKLMTLAVEGLLVQGPWVWRGNGCVRTIFLRT